MAEVNERSIGNIENYYGGLSVKREDGRFWWSIENWTGDTWEEIPEWLYRALVAFDDKVEGCEFTTPADRVNPDLDAGVEQAGGPPVSISTKGYDTSGDSGRAVYTRTAGSGDA